MTRPGRVLQIVIGPSPMTNFDVTLSDVRESHDPC